MDNNVRLEEVIKYKQITQSISKSLNIDESKVICITPERYKKYSSLYDYFLRNNEIEVLVMLQSKFPEFNL